jgi:hypothetical protein
MTYPVKGRRVENLGENVSEWCRLTGEGSTTHDVCLDHAYDLETNSHYYDHILHPRGTNPTYGDEPQGDYGWGGDVEHPPYGEMDPADRCCVICDVELLDEQEGAS